MTHRARALLLALLAVPLWLLGSTAASAHTSLTSSSPADGSTVTDPLAAVVLTFGGAVRGPEVEVTGPDGAAVGGTATAEGSVVTVPVAPVSAGAHTVTWAVTSGDGHELAGTLAFDYAGPLPTPAPAPATTEATTEEAPAPTTAAPTVSGEPSEAAATRDDSGPNLLVRGVQALVVAAVVGGVVWVVRRRQTSGSAGKSR